MSDFIDLIDEKRRREKFTIALAQSVQAAINENDPLDPEPLGPFLLELVKDLKQGGPEYGDVDWHYKDCCASRVAQQNPVYSLVQVATLDGPKVVLATEAIHLPTFRGEMPITPEQHADALAWAMAYLIELEERTGLTLVDMRGRR